MHAHNHMPSISPLQATQHCFEDVSLCLASHRHMSGCAQTHVHVVVTVKVSSFICPCACTSADSDAVWVLQDPLGGECSSQCCQPQPGPLLRLCGRLGSGGCSQCCHHRPVCGPCHHAVHAVLEGRAAAVRFEKPACSQGAHTHGTGIA